MCRTQWEEVWRFETANLSVVLEVTPCTDDPAESFEFPEDIEAINSGLVDWFNARTRVLTKAGEELGADYLGSCSYNSVREFFTSHRTADALNRNCSVMREVRGQNVVICEYFPSMVREAIRSARHTLSKLKALRVREVV